MDITTKIIDLFSGENSLISTNVEEIKLEKDEFGELQIHILISNFSKKSKFFRVHLLFTKIVEFQFYYSSNYSFYNIENYKLLYIEDQVYLSLDPDEHLESKSDKDLDFILAKNVLLL
ncbi:hypothetical protein OZ666_01800 [Elizabethkingia sp. HX QKY]|uniref:hypothetical protein n=1 Tax=Elizabethkingia TaxID=308865 RepID=UPI002A23F5F0|nr:hypothetical protein [Elizabethkingia sp. HX QKY]MDX8570397.1 hypothetical protein [Elizabethkingia sp. HX QKY]